MTGSEVLPWFGTIGGIVALLTLAWTVVKEVRGGAIRKGNADAAKAALDAEQAEAALPHVQRSLELGNVGTAVSIQQNIINGLQEHVTWQDGQIAERDTRIAALERGRAEYEAKVVALERRLREAERALSAARAALDAIRATSEATHQQEDRGRA